MKASDLFVAQLEEEGTEYIFGLPGEENLDFLESLRISGIKLIVTRHEQAAAFMATTYGSCLLYTSQYSSSLRINPIFHGFLTDKWTNKLYIYIHLRKVS